MVGRSDPLQFPIAVLLSVVACFAWLGADLYGAELLMEIAILSIFAMSLDLIVGYTGMVSLGHAAFLAIGGYVTAASTVLLAWPPITGLVCSVAVSAIVAFVVGLFVTRLTGIFFIMITLAVGQMFHAFFFRAKILGGDDGMFGTPRIDLAFFGLDSGNPHVFAALLIIVAAMVYMGLVLFTRSPFGMVLSGIRENENRLRALGCPVRRYKLSVFSVAGAIAGLSGALMAQHTGFVAPDLAFWTLSGEILIVVIVGGSGSLVGPVGATALLILLRDQLSTGEFWERLGLSARLSGHWKLMMGLFFIGVVLTARDGLYGLLTRLLDIVTQRWGRSN